MAAVVTAQPNGTQPNPDRRTRRRRLHRRPDPARATPTAAPQPGPALVLKYDTTPADTDTADAADVVAAWRARGWTD